LILSVIYISSPVQAYVKNNVVEFNILALRADQAINLFGKQSNITVIYRFDKIKKYKTNEVKGKYSIKAAIDKLLEGTRLLHEFDSTGNLVVMEEKTHLAHQTSNVDANIHNNAELNSFIKESEDRLEIITVEARRKVENIQKVPMSVVVTSSELLKKFGIVSIQGISQFSPSLNIQGGVDTNSSRFFIRGVGTATPTFGTEPSVPIYVDDIYRPIGLGSNIDIFAIDRIEVLNGPQGTMYGRNSFGGAVKLYSKPLGDELEGNLSFTIGSYDQQNFKVEVDTPLIDEKLWAGFAFANIQNDGIQTIIHVPGGKGWQDDKQLYRLRLAAKPSDDVLFKFTYEKNNDSGLTQQIKIKPGTNGDITSSINPNIVAFNDIRENIGLEPIQLLEPIFPLETSAVDDIESDIVSEALVEQESYTLSTMYQINSNFTLKYLASKSTQNNIRAFDLDGTPAPLFAVREDFKFDVFSNELRLEYQGKNFDIVTGMFYYKEKSDVHQVFNNPLVLDTIAQAYKTGFTTDGRPFKPETDVAAVTDIQGRVTALNIGSALNQFRQETISKAIYSNASYRLNDDLRFSLGARYTTDDKVAETPVGNFDQGVSVILNNAVFPLTGDIIPQGGVDGEIFLDLVNGPNNAGFNFSSVSNIGDEGVDEFGDVGPVTDTFSEVTFEFTLDYDFNENTLVYGSFKQGFQAGLLAPNNLATQIGLSPSAAPQSTDSQKIDAFEIGFKSVMLNGDFVLNGATYWYDWSDIILFSQVEVDDPLLAISGQVGIATNAGKATTLGFEIESKYLMTEDIFLYSNIAFHHFNLDSVSGLDQETGKIIDIVGDFNDNISVATPDFKALLGIEYYTEVGSSQIRYWLNAAYRGDVSTNNRAQSQSGGLNILVASDDESAYTSKSYTNLSAGITYTSLENNWRIDLSGSNLLDERRVESTIYDTPGFLGRGQLYNKPLIWQLSIDYSF